MRSKKILTVDDDPFYGNLYRDILEAHGYRTKQAFNASDGLRLAGEFRPDLIILDVMMPEREGLLDGYGLLEELRNERKFRSLPVVMVTALNEDGDRQRAFDLGATDYLPKQDLSPDGLIHLIEAYLKR
ncbi:hypothetical protein COY93_01100 [Candidatus Uhrbacteria bacterium CG_4_10_14_0_8_um_filter_58_22]|uniref:Response regulatory domain-containing protein n=1 Tax=Candidatus Uhrbacteria bacterium CG_4_10_14_0_8_um_filter_58_22 TaxID=1975029 RepID=A0A2M7QC02_9BACT|nr:MAG: hypothetical protein AUJ19_00265 [Parcubacteria group bacterium CG1_02_58_44]PIY63195.1 MAG: hypothetical protein COY93_01100 [Candidatus Uhrbacteria bacterium CG_4_10_14_0_8_um_filter_58_22]